MQVFIPSNSSPNLVQGPLTVTGNTILEQNLTVDGNEVIDGNLTVLGTINGGGGGTNVTTTTINNDTLPASFTTLTSSSTTSLATSNGTVTTQFNTLDNGTNGHMTLADGITITGNTITNSTGAVSTLPSTTGTLALVPASGSYVTTTTLDNDTLPASLTTLATSGDITASGRGIFSGWGGSSSVANAQIGVSGGVANIQGFAASTGTINLQLNANGGSVLTEYNIMDDGSGNITAHNNIILLGSLVFETSGTPTIYTDSATLLLPMTSGTLALAPSSGTVVTTTTIDNDTLPASFTTLTSSSTTSLNSTTIPASSTLVTTTTVDNNTLPASFTTLAVSGNETVGGTLTVNSTANSNIASNGLTIGQGAITVNFQGLEILNNQSTFVSSLQAVKNGVAYTTLDLNPQGTPVVVGGTLAIGGTAVITAGAGTAIALPASNGTLALQLGYMLANSSTVTSGSFASYTVVSSNGITVSTPGVFTLPAGTFDITANCVGTVSATSTAELVITTSVTTVPVQGQVYNSGISNNMSTVTTCLYSSASSSTLSFQPSGFNSPNGSVSIVQRA